MVLLPLTWSLNSPPFAVRETRHSYIAHSLRTLTLLFEGTNVTLSCVEQQEVRKISSYMEIGSSYMMGLIHHMVWGLVGISYRGYPLNFGRSNIVNGFGSDPPYRMWNSIVETSYWTSSCYFCKGGTYFTSDSFGWNPTRCHVIQWAHKIRIKV